MTTIAQRKPELANTLTHGLGLVASIALTPLLVVEAVRRGGAPEIVAASIFGAALVLLYLASTCYHAAPTGHLKEKLRRLDHAAIFVLIAGTYTPFTLGVLGGGWGWSIFGVVWGGASAGIVTKLWAGVRWPRLSTALYLILGWTVLVALGPLVRALPPAGLAWLVAGGVAYSAGVPFYVSRRLRHGHAVWHLFVLGGSTCHAVAVWGWALG